MHSKEIYIASDHAGFAMKQALAGALREWGHIVHDLGPENDSRVDYPDFAAKLAAAMKPVPDSFGVLICGSGIGIAMAANRHNWIRAATCHNGLEARLARAHNNANVIAFGARLIGRDVAEDALETFLATDFEGGRHEARVTKLGKPTP